MTLALKTAIIDNECLIKLIKFILEGPKYLFPRSDGIVAKLFSILLKDPEKLLHVAFSFISF